MTDCTRIGRIIGGCKFSPRYDLGPPQEIEARRMSEAGLIALMETSKPKTYVRDVCERCGKTVERKAGVS